MESPDGDEGAGPHLWMENLEHADSPKDRQRFIEHMTSQVVARGRVWWQTGLDEVQVRALLAAAMAIADLEYTADLAAAWGERNFPNGIPEGTVQSHEGELRTFGGDFDAMVQSRLVTLRPGRLNAERVLALHPTNPEISRLLDLADGIEVATPPGFYPNGDRAAERPPLRKLYLKAHKAVDKMIYDLIEKGLAIVLTAPTAFGIPGLHLSPAHWAAKAGKEHGRPLIDSTDANSPYPVLNSESVAQWAQDYFGEIKHPTIVDIVLMIWAFKQAHPGAAWDGIALFKMDLKGAYNLISFKPHYCKLFAVELVGGLVVIFLCGLFGWSATPAAFQVVTRALVFELLLVLYGGCLMYVDDIIVVTLVDKLSADKAAARSLCVGLLGPLAVADDKTEDTEGGGPRRLDAIGYVLDMDNQLVTLTRRNLLRTVYAFFSVDLYGRIPVPAVQRLASLASRYCAIVPELRPFSRALHACVIGVRNQRGSVFLTPEARLSVELWRTMLCAIALDERGFARPFATFVPRQATVVVQFDASLQGIGILVSTRSPGTADEVSVGGTVVPLTAWQWDEEDSAFQNTAEFMAVIVGILSVWRHVPREQASAILLKGDSVTALQWAKSGRVRSDRSARAACIFVLILTRLGVCICDTIHVPAELNGECDLLSRRGYDGTYRTVAEVVPGIPDLLMQEDPWVRTALRLCDPSHGAGSLGVNNFELFWIEAGDFIEKLRSGL